MNKKNSFKSKNLKTKKKINERETLKNKPMIKLQNRSYKSSSNLHYNLNNNKKSEKYKTILNGSINNLKIKEKNTKFKKK